MKSQVKYLMDLNYYHNKTKGCVSKWISREFMYLSKCGFLQHIKNA